MKAGLSMNPNIYDQLIRDEGFRPRPYRDNLGHWTVGYGWSLETGPPLSEETARIILNEHVGMIVTDLHSRLPWTKQLSQPRFGVLVNMVFNLGIRGLISFRRMLAALQIEDYDTAAAEMLNSRWNRQVGGKSSQTRTTNVGE